MQSVIKKCLDDHIKDITYKLEVAKCTTNKSNEKIAKKCQVCNKTETIYIYASISHLQTKYTVVHHSITV